MDDIKRRFTQFNELVFDDYDVSTDYSVTLKTETNSYAYGSGSQPLLRQGTQYVEEQNISLTLKLSTKALRCGETCLYKDHVMLNLLKPGKLWAVECNKPIWAYAAVTDYSGFYNNGLGALEIDVSFVLYEGYWHRANPMTTYLSPYSSCDFNIYDEYKKVETLCGTEECTLCDAGCNSDPVTPGVRLCDRNCRAPADDLCTANSALVSRCAPNYRFVIDCERALVEKGNTDLLGLRFCKQDECESFLAERFYSDTILDTQGVTVVIDGHVVNPYVTINGNKIQIIGEYDGFLTVTGDGSAYYQYSECCEPERIAEDNIKVPLGSYPRLTVHHGWNTLVIEMNDCCEMVCAHITIDSITP